MSAPQQPFRQPMMELDELARAVGGRVVGSPAARFFGVASDTRLLAPGDLFVALQGERFDGDTYVAEAIRRGASAALTSRVAEAEFPISQVVVENPRAALGRLAAAWRERFQLPIVALTGSNGKTTVKEMLAAILACHCGAPDLVLATEGNLNNDIGMPLTLLRLRDAHRYAVIEMGMNHEGEIDYLTRLSEPTVALVNNAHRAHVGILGSVEAIARAKGEIYAGLRAGGIAIVNADDPFAPYWEKLNDGRRVVTFGLERPADVSATLQGNQARFVMPTDAFAVTLQVSGDHNVRNAIAACAAAYALEIPPEAMQGGLRGFAGVPGRLQRRPTPEGAWVIDDTYNANPDSMKAAIRVLAAAPAPRVFVMGDMGELGAESQALHAEVGAFAKASGIESLLTLGPATLAAVDAFGNGAQHHADLDSLLLAARLRATSGATVLVKGSRFMQMERVADALAMGGDHAV